MKKNLLLCPTRSSHAHGEALPVENSTIAYTTPSCCRDLVNLSLALLDQEGGDDIKPYVWIPRRCRTFGIEIDLIESTTTPTTIS